MQYGEGEETCKDGTTYIGFYKDERRHKDLKFVDVTEDQQFINSQNNEDQNKGDNVCNFILSNGDLSTKPWNSFCNSFNQDE